MDDPRALGIRVLTMEPYTLVSLKEPRGKI